MHNPRKKIAFKAVCSLGLALLILTAPALSETMNLSVQDMDAITAYNNGADLASQGKFNEALASTNEALSLQPNFSLAWAQKAGLLVVLGRNEEAVTAADNAIAANSNISEAWASRADALNNLGKYAEALDSARQAVVLDPGLAEGWANEATAFNNLGRYQDAIQAANKALSINPDLPAALSAKGFATAMLQQANTTTSSPTSAPLSAVVPILALVGAGIAFAIVWRRG